MTTHPLLRRGARRRTVGALAVAVVLTTVVTVGMRPTTAAWVTSASVGQAVGVASSTCTTPGVYRTTASSRFLAGSVAGVPLTGASALAAVTADDPATSTSVSSSAGVANATIAAAVQGAAGVPTLSAPTGSQSQVTSATSTGTSSAGAGAVTSAGALDLAGRAALGDVDLSAALGAVPGGTAAAGPLSQLGMTIGSIGSSASLNECARRWGAALSSALQRDAGASALSLRMKDAAVSALRNAIIARRADVATAFSGVDGTATTSGAAGSVAATAKTGLTSAVSSALATLAPTAVVGSATGSVSISSDLSDLDAAAGRAPSDASGLVRVDGGTGVVTADLAKLVDPTAPAPNTSLVTGTDTAAIATGAATAVASLTNGVNTALDSAVTGTRVVVDVSVPVTLVGAPLLTVRQRMDGSLADYLSSDTVWDPPVVSVLGALDAGALLAALLPKISSLLIGPVRTTVGTTVSTPLLAAAGTAKSALTSALASTRSALPTELATLTGLVSVTLNEQPDVAPRPTPAAGLGGGFVVTAVRIRVRVAGADALDLAVASTSVGPNRTINDP